MSIVHYIKAAVLFLIGFFSVFTFGGYWAALNSLQVLQIVMPLWVFGVVMMLGGTLIVIRKARVFGYFLGFVAFGALVITGFIGLHTLSPPHSPVFFALIIAALSYGEGLYQTIRDIYYEE